jgi:hypothetical protein
VEFWGSMSCAQVSGAEGSKVAGQPDVTRGSWGAGRWQGVGLALGPP